jgi:hypothetical protein
LGVVASGGVTVEAHDYPKAGDEEREARRGDAEVATRMAEHSRQRKAEGKGEWPAPRPNT